MSLIDPNAVEAAYVSCLHTDEEMASLPDGADAPEGAIIVQGVINRHGFHPDRVETQREQVSEWLAALPEMFRKTPSGGWSFLNACVDRNDEQWTGLHLRMDQLIALGQALGLAGWVLPDPEMWKMLPGGMPYFWVADEVAVHA